MATLNDLILIQIKNRTEEQLAQLKEDVLSLSLQEQEEFLLNILDNQYSIFQRNSKVELFLKDREFRGLHSKILRDCANRERQRTSTIVPARRREVVKHKDEEDVEVYQLD